MKKYAYANVKIPLEVLSNGNFELLKEHIQVEFTHCKELPPKQELNMDFSSILNDLFTQKKMNMNEEKQDNEKEIKIKTMVEEPEQEKKNKKELKQEENRENQQEVEKMIILSSEIKKNKNMNKNTSFKNRKNSHNFTNKSRY